MLNKISVILIFMCSVSCNQTKKQIKKLNLKEFESSFILSNDNDSIAIDIESLDSHLFDYDSDPIYIIRPNKPVASVELSTIKKSIKFGEPFEEKIEQTNYNFNKNNKLISEKTIFFKKKTVDNYQTPSNFDALDYYLLENKYKKKISETKCYYDKTKQKILKKILKRTSRISLDSIYNLDSTYYYDKTKNKRLKEWLGKEDCIKPDSIVIKYEYYNDKLSNAFVYDGKGEEILDIYYNYDSNENTYTITTEPPKADALMGHFSDKKDRLVLYFDENCNLNKKMLVSQNNGATSIKRKEYNNFGDVIEILNFKIKNTKIFDLNYKDYDEILKQTPSEKVMNYFSSSYYYVYDKYKNWIIMNEGFDDKIIHRRKIIYRK